VAKPDHAGVRIPPPLIFLTFLVAGLLLDSGWIRGVLPPLPFTIAGAILFLAALALLLLSAEKFHRAKTHLEPWKPTTQIITNGIYRYSRNPIYLSMAIAYAGISTAAASWTAIILLIPCLFIIHYYVIMKEEAYLEDKFGKEYLAYRAKVRRWL
jgi:protein-S-isoprenylcysteine O-methyltransferase Ste14|tara:strand:+ start:350 stop:814 length:465 start_codon:yes stop_codon:yes gene_type:complete